MEFRKKIDLSKKPAKSLLKTSSNSDKKEKKKNCVVWDIKNLEENAEYLRLNPPTMRIEEPKTPYDPYEQGDDSYLEKVRQMFNVKPTEDVLNDVSNELMKHFDSKGNQKDNDEYVEIEVYENGELVKKKVSKNHRDNIEFLKKRRVAYGNEYTNAKKQMESEKEEKNSIKKERELTEEDLKEIELDDQTVKNTIINKFSSMIFRRQKDEELKKLNEKKKNENKNKDDENKEEEKTHKKKERKKIVFLEKTEEIPNVEFQGEKELKKEEENHNQ